MKKFLLILTSALVLSGIFVSCSKSNVVINSADDLNGKKIGVQTGTTGEMWVQDNVQNVSLSSFKTGIDASLDLKNGAIDAVVLDELPAKEIVSRNSSLKIVDIDLATEEYAIAVKKGNSELLSQINKTIEDMKANGGYVSLVNAFMPVDGNIKIPTSERIYSSKVVRLGTNAAFPPFEYVNGKDVVGFDITMGEEIAKTANAQLEVVDMAFDSLIPALASDAIDFIAAGMSVTDERKKNVDFSVPYYQSKQVVIVRK